MPANCYLVIVSVDVCEDDPPKVKGPMTEDELVNTLSSLVGKKCFVYVFRGERYEISEGPWRHLITPEKIRIPLFKVPAANNIDPTGALFTPDESDSEY